MIAQILQPLIDVEEWFLEVLRRLAAVLGAKLLVEEGDDLADVVVRTARERGTTYVFMGAPSTRRGLGRFTEPIPQRIVRALPEVDVRLVARRSGVDGRRRCARLAGPEGADLADHSLAARA